MVQVTRVQEKPAQPVSADILLIEPMLARNTWAGVWGSRFPEHREGDGEVPLMVHPVIDKACAAAVRLPFQMPEQGTA